MKNYVKPMVLANEELAEGVYTYSGGTGCFTYDSYSGGSPSGNENYYEYNVRFKHADEAHMACTHKIVIYFSGNVQAVRDVTNTDGSEPVISGNTVTVVWQQQQANGADEYANIGIKVLATVGTVVPTGGYGYVAS